MNAKKFEKLKKILHENQKSIIQVNFDLSYGSILKFSPERMKVDESSIMINDSVIRQMEINKCSILYGNYDEEVIG